jgi:hypothetical protein
MPAKLCVGAVSRRVIEVAASLRVAHIVASRRQVDGFHGYTGLNQRELVELVDRLSNQHTRVVRDHGGPMQGPFVDDGVESLRKDVEAGFHALHLDVSKLPHNEQVKALCELVATFREVPLEVGGERDEWSWNKQLLHIARDMADKPVTVVMDTGCKIWNDRQVGSLAPDFALKMRVAEMDRMGAVATKAHNCDWLCGSKRRDLPVAYYNLAPELAQVEIDALLTVLPSHVSMALLREAYNSKAWTRWYHETEGTWFERARTAVRYIIDSHRTRLEYFISSEEEDFIRTRIADAIQCG